MFLAFAGHFILTEVSNSASMHFLISLTGILIMSAAAWLLSWYKAEVNKSGKRAKSADSDADFAGGDA